MLLRILATPPLLLAMLFSDLLAAQQIPRPNQNMNRVLIQGRNFEPLNSANSQDLAHASLKTDPELEAILEKAERFRSEGQYGVASKLWQSVLERSGDALYSSDGKIFFSLAQQVEDILAQLKPDDGLSAYRITADANAKAILAEANEPYDETALRKIVRSYFLSSVGDDAAFTLSSIYMDQFDFVGAFRMLEKITRNYPDPSVSLVDVYARMSLCQAMMGEESNALDAIAKAKELSQGVLNRNVSDVEKAIPSLIGQKVATGKADRVDMVLANRSRSGTMPALPDPYLQHDFQAVWQYYFHPKTLRWPDLKEIKPAMGKEAVDLEDRVTGEEQLMIEQWRKMKWRPSGHLLFHNDKVYFKTSLDMSAWNRDADTEQVAWRPLWRNRYQMDDNTRSMIEMQGRLRRGSNQFKQPDDYPTKSYEVQLFADGISSQLSIQNGVLYSIEGNRFNDIYSSYQPPRSFRYGSIYRRSRSNHLTAYDAESGKLLWTLPKQNDAVNPIDPIDPNQRKLVPNIEVPVMDETSDEGPWISSGGFMSAPLHYGGLLIVPVNNGGAISIYALDPNQEGKTVWKSYLCDEPETGANPHSPINLSIDGSDLFASCGLGVVFILDPTTGLIRFAKPYERSGKVVYQSSSRWRARPNRFQFDRWLSDTIIPFGRQMVCFSSDAKYIEALDRNTGQLIWRGHTRPLEAKVDYIIGVYDDILYAGGSETILAYNLAEEGRMVWGGGKIFDGEISYGRGMVTPNGVFVPVDNEIHLFSLKGKDNRPEKLGEYKVLSGVDAPIGNLFSDGEKIWVHGANRLYALGAWP